MALVRRVRRIVIDPPYDSEALPVAHWINGTTLGTEGDDLVYRTKGKARTVGLKAVLDAWLMEDALWGGHKAANALRYQHLNGYELGLTVRDLLPQPDGTALGVASVQLLQRPSTLGYPQVLFRFRPGSEGLEPLRTLSTEGMPFVGLPPHRLFRLERRQILQDRDISELLPSGASGKIVQALPPSTVSLGASDGRWLLLRTEGRPGHSAGLRVYDAPTGRLTDVFPEADF